MRGNYWDVPLLTGFYGLGHMPNEFQRVMGSLLRSTTFPNCNDDDILIASKGSLEEHRDIVMKILNILKIKNMAVKWEKIAFFQKDIEWLGFTISNTAVKPLGGKADSIKTSRNRKTFQN